ncbi:hypothetical protein DK419_09450 [Methylobacterium terrae]|uniref:Uncharacterized protein n=2 Tax=Methylobacterium terrae TaxID=2202827 RepID=A0A2U8WLZ4_9HYPH|nr:hypothetical protein DK419_09450 [Methylobacterium terrae]
MLGAAVLATMSVFAATPAAACQGAACYARPGYAAGPGAVRPGATYAPPTQVGKTNPLVGQDAATAKNLGRTGAVLNPGNINPGFRPR